MSKFQLEITSYLSLHDHFYNQLFSIISLYPINFEKKQIYPVFQLEIFYLLMCHTFDIFDIFRNQAISLNLFKIDDFFQLENVI